MMKDVKKQEFRGNRFKIALKQRKTKKTSLILL